jgi:site-specific DNA-methyltransferase (adenine-specific)
MQSTLPTMLFSKESDEWATPWPLFNWLNSSFQFTLDPCATAETAKCIKFYTQTEDGLLQSWANERVFMNPPYSAAIKWMKKAWTEAQLGATVVCLVAARTDTRWFQDYVIGKANEIQFLPGRVTFLRPEKAANTAPFPSCVIVYRPPVERRFLRLRPTASGD